MSPTRSEDAAPAREPTPREEDPDRVGTTAQGRELRARGRRTRRKLLDAGTRVFARKGYHATRVDDIVKLARTSHGTFYLYFANKEDLFATLVAEVADDLAGLADEVGPIGPNAAGRRALRDWIERFAATYEQFGPVIRTWTEAEAGDTEVGRMGADVLGRLTESLTDRVRDATSEDLDPVVASLAIVAMIDRFTYFTLTEQITAERDAILDTLSAVTHAALFGPSPRRRR